MLAGAEGPMARLLGAAAATWGMEGPYSSSEDPASGAIPSVLEGSCGPAAWTLAGGDSTPPWSSVERLRFESEGGSCGPMDDILGASGVREDRCLWHCWGPRRVRRLAGFNVGKGKAAETKRRDESRCVDCRHLQFRKDPLADDVAMAGID